MQDLDPSDICKKNFLNPLKRIRVIIRTPTHGRTDGRTDGRTGGQTDGRTGWIQYTPPQLRCGGYNKFRIWAIVLRVSTWSAFRPPAVLINPNERYPSPRSQRAHDAIIASLLRRNDVATTWDYYSSLSFDVITLLLRRVAGLTDSSRGIGRFILKCGTLVVKIYRFD